MADTLKIDDLIDEATSLFDAPESHDYAFFQELVNYLTLRTNKLKITCNDVVFYGDYTINLSGRKIILHFTVGKFTHLTSVNQPISQTYNPNSFEQGAK
jgi:hypothetical protein